MSISILFMINRRKNGFTLYELVISIALLSLVAIAVLSFIIYLNAFIKTTKVEQKKIQNQTLLQQYTDLWFSYYDNENYEFLTNVSADYVVAAQNINNKNTYKIKAENNNDSLILIFEFPQASTQNNISLNLNFANKFNIIKFSQSIEESNGEAFSFTVNLHVKNEFFRCDLIYI